MGWWTRPIDPHLARLDADTFGFEGVILEGEIPAQILTGDGPIWNPQAQDWAAVVEAFRTYAGDKAVATSWSPFQTYVLEGGSWLVRPNRALADPLVDAGWYALPYVYPAEHPGITIEAQVGYGAFLGWPDGEPVLGCYGGFELEDFPTRFDYAGFSIWDAGEVF